MRHVAPSLVGLFLLFPVPAPAQDVPGLRATYEMYASGLHVAEIEATLGIGRHRYELRIAYHTTGLVGIFRHGHQANAVVGTWEAGQPMPLHYQAAGEWHGEPNLTLIDYLNGQPMVERLVPPQKAEREPVPVALQQNSIDTLSALALLIRRVQDTGRCETSVHTFDGHRANEISAHTVGEEILAPTGGSDFSGEALRCDFIGQMLAGFLYQEDGPSDRRPLHGSAWLATVVPGAPPVPVRMEFETRWFGDAYMYLTHLAPEPVPPPAPPTEVAAH